MQRNTAHVTQALSSTGRSVMRFEVQKVVKGGSKTRLLILNVDIRVLIQASFWLQLCFGQCVPSCLLLWLLFLCLLQLIVVP